MNTIPAQEIKRPVIAAVDVLITKGDVHVIRNNQPHYVVVLEACYQALLEAKPIGDRPRFHRRINNSCKPW